MWRLRVFAKTDIIRPHQENNFFDRWPCRFIQVQQFPQFFFIFIFLLNSFLYPSSLLLFKIFKAQRREMKKTHLLPVPRLAQRTKKKERKKILQSLWYCSCWPCYPVAFQWRPEWDRTDSLPDLCAWGGNFSSPGKSQVSQRPPTVEQGADCADKRMTEAGCRRSKGKKKYCCVYFSPVSFQKKDIFLPSICIRMSKFSLFLITFCIRADNVWCQVVSHGGLSTAKSYIWRSGFTGRSSS